MLKTGPLLIAFTLFAGSLQSVACGNEYYTTAIPLKTGKLTLHYLLHYPGDAQLPYWSQGFGENILNRKNELVVQITGGRHRAGLVSWNALEKALEKNMDYKLLSDFAWYELRAGNKQYAVRLLERLYEKYPDEYNIVANLGTAYEVTGKNEQALALLKKAVAIDPASHHGSEWIHVNILEQKVKANPDYTLVLDLGSGKDYSRWLTGKTYDKPIKPDSLMIQLAYQLHERIGFVAPPDPIVAQLVLDFADLAAIAYSKEQAKEFYDYAVSYDQSLAPTATERTGATVAQAKVGTTVAGMHAKDKTSGFNWWYVAIPALAAGMVAWFLVRQRKKISPEPLP